MQQDIPDSTYVHNKTQGPAIASAGAAAGSVSVSGQAGSSHSVNKQVCNYATDNSLLLGSNVTEEVSAITVCPLPENITVQNPDCPLPEQITVQNPDWVKELEECVRTKEAKAKSKG